MICHLTDAGRMALGEKEVSPATGILQRTVITWIALYAPVQWPSGVETRPEIDQLCAGTTPAVFAADVAELEAMLRRLSMIRRGYRWPAHPIFGPMSQRAWMRWGYLHADHHLRQFGA